MVQTFINDLRVINLCSFNHFFPNSVPPTIEDGEPAVAATVNSRTQLRCEALGLPDPEVTWEKNGKRIPSNGQNYRLHRSGTLEFSAVKEEDSGDYR